MQGIFKGHKASIDRLAFSSNGKFLAFASDNLIVHIWGINIREQLKVLSNYTSYIVLVSFSADKECLAFVL